MRSCPYLTWGTQEQDTAENHECEKLLSHPDGGVSLRLEVSWELEGVVWVEIENLELLACMNELRQGRWRVGRIEGQDGPGETLTFCFVVMAAPHILRDLSSPTRDRTRAPCSGRAES